MKSTLKVSYQCRYGLSDREPVIKVDLAESDDPRDLLLKDLFEDGASIGIAREQKSNRAVGPEGEEETILFYRKKPHELVHEVAFDVIQIIDLMYPDYRFLLIYDGIKNFYFTTHLDEHFKSEEMDINHLIWHGPHDIRKNFVANFKRFLEKLLDPKTPMSFNLAKALTEFDAKQMERLPDGTELRSIKMDYQPYLNHTKSRGYPEV